ncbi:MAG: molybdenum cofactor biosynthesis protein MoaE [Actinobacteria bacterium]|nr:molybdenum cofactor biosynthesis protein MoaE [Actinomycetota bacterium]
MDRAQPPFQTWLDEIKSSPDCSRIGMLLMHNGIVRGTARDGSVVQGMDLSYDRNRLEQVVAGACSMPGVIAVRVWINEGRLAVGDDIMYVLVAGDIRDHVFNGLKELVRRIKTEVVSEWEIR